MTRRGGHELSTEEAADLLAELNARLRHRGVPASIFVVGGAAIAATGVRSGRLTEDWAPQTVRLTRGCMRTPKEKLLNNVERPNAYREVLISSAGSTIVLSLWDGRPGQAAVIFLPGTMTHPLFYEELLPTLRCRPSWTVSRISKAGPPTRQERPPRPIRSRNHPRATC